MKILALLPVVLLLGGCARVTITVDETDIDGAFRVTRFSAYTFFESRSDLVKLKTTLTEKTQGLSIGSLNQESTATNLVPLAKAVAEGVSAGVVKSFVPKP